MSDIEHEDAAQIALRQKGLKYACTDMGNGERFVDRYGQMVRYVIETNDWWVWEGGRWKPGKDKVKGLAQKVARSIHKEALKCENAGGRQELNNWIKQSEMKHRQDAMLDQAISDLAVSMHDFDTDPNTVNCLDCVVNLKTGERHNHSPKQLHTRQVPVKYDPKARCDRWQAFMLEVFADDKALVEWMQRALGYSLTGLTREQCLFVLYGLGENGKTMLAETILRTLGEGKQECRYTKTVRFDAFIEKKNKQVRDMEAIGHLRGVRFARAVETKGTEQWDGPQVKSATGEDMLEGAQLGKGAFDFLPTHKLWMLCNRIPGFKDGSHGMKRRFRIIPLTVDFSQTGTRDKGLLDKLLAEREGILAWLVEGARAYYVKGLDDLPEAVQEATDDYIAVNDPLGEFVKLYADPNAKAPSGELWTSYVSYCTEKGLASGEQQFFKGNLEERGIKQTRGSAGRFYVGIGLKPNVPKPANDNWEYKGNGLSVFKPKGISTGEEVLARLFAK